MLKQLRIPLVIATCGLFSYGVAYAEPKTQAPAAAQQPAQQQQQQPAQQPAQQEKAPLSEKKVDSFISAYSAVHEINQEYSEKLQSVSDAEKATQLQQEAQGKMQKAVKDSGLSIEEYQKIASRASSDDELRSRIQNAFD